VSRGTARELVTRGAARGLVVTGAGAKDRDGRSST